MTRRTYLKNLFFLGAIGATSFSIFKWVRLNEPIDPGQLIKKREVLAELAELIIPATDTPGAKAAGVHDYIINVVINCNQPKEQENFLHGIESLEGYALQNYGRDFLKCSLKQRTETLEYFDQHGEFSNRILNKINNKIFGQPFFPHLKALTIQGYCVSMLGATQGLAYDYIPGTYEACIPLLKNQRSWATK